MRLLNTAARQAQYEENESKQRYEQHLINSASGPDGWVPNVYIQPKYLIRTEPIFFSKINQTSPNISAI